MKLANIYELYSLDPGLEPLFHRVNPDMHQNEMDSKHRSPHM